MTQQSGKYKVYKIKGFNVENSRKSIIDANYK